jgi:polysaccharide biosynthesis protein PslH
LRIGTQTKVLEAMSCATPVVTTSAGNHGVGAVDGTDLHVADDPAQFADCVVRLLQGERWAPMSESARRFVVGHFTWEKSIDRFEGMLQELARARGASAISAGAPTTTA